MTKSGHILAINPGSTSTKLAIYHFNTQEMQLDLIQEVNLSHTLAHDSMEAQLDMRHTAVEAFLAESNLDIQIIMARSAPLKPLTGGTYAVNEAMLEDIRVNRYSRHASNFAALIGDQIGKEHQIPVYITDPITTDELDPVARISGVPGIERKSRSHALNIKASLRKLCQKTGKSLNGTNWVVCHMGGGISVVAVKNGLLVDVNDALLGMGPFSPERAGSLPLSGILEMVYNGDRQRADVERILAKESGLKGYLGTADLQKVEEMIRKGDSKAELTFLALSYQIAKEIAAMASVLKFDLEGILLTGGMAHSTKLVDDLTHRLQPLAPVYIEAGENELEALAQAAFRVASGEEDILEYEQ